jgi:hypothetical protein
MIHLINKLRNSLASKLILTVGTVLLFTIATWAFFNIRHQKEKMMTNMVAGTDRLTTTIRLGTHYAMMLNSRDEINQIINNIGRQAGNPEHSHLQQSGRNQVLQQSGRSRTENQYQGRSLPHLPPK